MVLCSRRLLHLHCVGVVRSRHNLSITFIENKLEKDFLLSGSGWGCVPGKCLTGE